MGVAGTNVRTVRQQLGMSLRALADAAQLDPATLSRIENGKQNLTEEIATKIARALNVSQGMLFADAAVLEVSMLRMRKAPLLTGEQLLAWRGPDGFEEPNELIYLHTGLEVTSRRVFAFAVPDMANAPQFVLGDVLLFDGGRNPVAGELVLSQTPDGNVYIGRLRVNDEGFDIVPSDRVFPEVRSTTSDHLVIRGVLAEQRRYFKR